MNIILLSGGSGKRLWPLSNDVRSKQFIKLFKNKDKYESMVQRVYRQITTIDADAKITIATSKSQASSIKNQLGEKTSICVEPCRRDTFPAIVLAVSYLHDELGVSSNEAVVVCPVDPYVDETYYESVEILHKLAEQGNTNLTLMGVEPTYPSEKYGYIIPTTSDNVSLVREFKEKPDAKSAQKYLEQNALWNAGIFAFKLGYLLVSGINSIGGTTFSIFLILVVFKSHRYIGRIYGYAIVPICVAAIIWLSFFREARRKKLILFNKGYWKYGLSISIPLVVHTFSQQILSQFDRIMINTLVSVAAVGIYGFIQTIASILQIIVQSMDNAWSVELYYVMMIIGIYHQMN